MASANQPHRRRFQPGERLFSEGECGETAYIIESGRVEVSHDINRDEVNRDDISRDGVNRDDISRDGVNHNGVGPAHGSVLDVGRKTRTIPPALRRALDARDRGCRFPGCGLRFTDAHHIKHWADGGETKLENTLLLCRSHHRKVHEGGYRVCSDRNGQVAFFTPMGKALFEVPPLPELPPDPVEVLVLGNRERGLRPDSRRRPRRRA